MYAHSLVTVRLLAFASLLLSHSVTAAAVGEKALVQRETSAYVQRFCNEYVTACGDVCTGSQTAKRRCLKESQSIKFECVCDGADRSIDVLDLLRGSSAETVTLPPHVLTKTRTVYVATVTTPAGAKRAAPSERAASIAETFCSDYTTGCQGRCQAIGSSTQYQTCTKKKSGLYTISCTCANGKEEGLHAYGINKVGDPAVTPTTRTHTVTPPATTTTVRETASGTVVLAPTGRLIVRGNGSYEKYVRTWTEDQTLDISSRGFASSCVEDYYGETYESDDYYCVNSKLEEYAFVATTETAPSGRRFYTLNNPDDHVRVIGTNLPSLYQPGDAGCVYGDIFMQNATWIESGKAEPLVYWDIQYAKANTDGILHPFAKASDGSFFELAARKNTTSIALSAASAPCTKRRLTLVYADLAP